LGLPPALGAPPPPPPPPPPPAAEASEQLRAHLLTRTTPAALRAGVATASPPVSLVSQAVLEGGKVESRFADGTRLVRFRNGTEREVSGDGGVTVRFPNGDVRRTLPSGEELYYYDAAGTLQHTRAGYDVFEFLATGQVELHWAPPHEARGVEVVFADGTVKYASAGGAEGTGLAAGSGNARASALT
jgi:hypothetical protein